jgi:YidC/Oxa1 family membrane protein insertase
MPGGDVGLAVIILTLLVKAILAPLSQRSIASQSKMKLLEPEIKKIKESGKSKEEQARLTFDLYKKNKTNPFAGCLLIFIQIPIIFALYYAFLKGIKFDGGLLYSFVHAPAHMNTNFLGFLDINARNLPLAILAGVTQYFQAHYMPKSAPADTGGKNSFADAFGKSMQLQMKYVFPFLIAFIAYGVSGAIALYWITSNLFTIFQQIYINKKHKNMAVVK